VKREAMRSHGVLREENDFDGADPPSDAGDVGNQGIRLTALSGPRILPLTPHPGSPPRQVFVPRASSVVMLKAALTNERRKNRRLRALLDTLREETQQNRHDLDVQTTRVAQLQAEVDVLKKQLPKP